MDSHPAGRHPYITTSSGQRINSLAVGAHDVVAADVAPALAKLCRYLGHCSNFYSVAEHSVLVSRIAEDARQDREVVRCALLHDAHEAFCGDMPSPYKNDLPGYHDWEGNFERVVRAALRLPHESSGVWQAVKRYDLEALHLEAWTLFPSHPEWVDVEVAERLDRQGHKVYCHDWWTAKILFRQRAAELGFVGF